MTRDRREAFEDLVRGWTGRVHHLAYRMLGDATEADDATQEVFLRLWERMDRYDPSRPFQPWIYQVATRSILNRIRGARTRGARESEVAPPREPEPTEDAVERREREAIVHEGLQGLDGEERAVLAMHYYGRLTQDQIALVLDVPRTTVQSRIGRALSSLRERVSAAGHLALVPSLEDLMRSSAPPPVPEHLAASLLEIAGTGTAGSVAGGAALLGGVVVTKKLVIVVAAIAALTLGGGYVAGRSAGSSGSEGAASTEHARLLEENRRLQEEIERRVSASGERASLAGAPTAPRAQGSPPTAARPSAPEAAASEAKPSGIDWSRLSGLLAKHADLLATLRERADAAGEKGDDAPDVEADLSPAERQAVMGLLAEYMSVSTQAQALSPHPFFDDRVLPDYVAAIVQGSLALEPAQRDRLREDVRGLLASHSKEVDLERLAPVERFALRGRIADAAMGAAREASGPEAGERYERLEPLLRRMLSGAYREVRLGIDVRPSLGERVLAAWTEGYGLDAKQADGLRPIADRYALDASDAVRRHGLEPAGSSARAREALDREMVALLTVAERGIDAVLTDAQRTAARRAMPTLVYVEPGAGETESIATDGGI